MHGEITGRGGHRSARGKYLCTGIFRENVFARNRRKTAGEEEEEGEIERFIGTLRDSSRNTL